VLLLTSLSGDRFSGKLLAYRHTQKKPAGLPLLLREGRPIFEKAMKTAEPEIEADSLMATRAARLRSGCVLAMSDAAGQLRSRRTEKLPARIIKKWRGSMDLV
jgi:hypothetical protein